MGTSVRSVLPGRFFRVFRFSGLLNKFSALEKGISHTITHKHTHTRLRLIRFISFDPLVGWQQIFALEIVTNLLPGVCTMRCCFFNFP